MIYRTLRDHPVRLSAFIPRRSNSGSFAKLAVVHCAEDKKPRGTNHAYKHCHASTVRVGTTHGCRWARPCHDHCRLQRDRRSDCRGGAGLCEASYNECAAMPDQPLHFPSERETILKSRFHLWQLQCDLHDTVLGSREVISQSLDLIAKVDEALAHTPFLVPPRY